MPKISQVTKRANAHDVTRGIAKRLAPGEELRLGGRPYTTKQIVALFEGHVAALDAIETARGALAAAVANERRRAREIRALTLMLRRYVTAYFGSRADVLADFGWKPHKKPGPKTTTAKLAGVEKARATRAARRRGKK